MYLCIESNTSPLHFTVVDVTKPEKTHKKTTFVDVDVDVDVDGDDEIEVRIPNPSYPSQAPSLAPKSTSLRIYCIYAPNFPRTNININNDINSEQRPEDRKDRNPLVTPKPPQN